MKWVKPNTRQRRSLKISPLQQLTPGLKTYPMGAGAYTVQKSPVTTVLVEVS